MKNRLIIFTILFVILLLLLKIFVFDIVTVSGSSMEPTLMYNQKLLVYKLSYRFKSPIRQDIIVLKSLDEQYVKRIIALPNDKIEIKNEKVYLNDKMLNETYIKDFTGGYFGQHIVQNNNVFVLGDNRNDSLDSRSSKLGDINIYNIVGKVILKW